MKYHPNYQMDIFEAVMIAEGTQPARSYAQYLAAWQQLHDTGMAYSLQGFFGRQAARMREEGLIDG